MRTREPSQAPPGGYITWEAIPLPIGVTLLHNGTWNPRPRGGGGGDVAPEIDIAQAAAQIRGAAQAGLQRDAVRRLDDAGSGPRELLADFVQLSGSVGGGLIGGAGGALATLGPWGAPAGAVVGAGLGAGIVYPAAQWIRGEPATAGGHGNAIVNGVLLEVGGQLTRAAVGAFTSAAGRFARLATRRALTNGAYRAEQFASQNLLDKHFAKHAGEWGAGNLTKAGYVKRAQDLLGRKVGGDILGAARANGDVLRYNLRTNEFAVGTADGAIRTLFRPKDGMAYWLLQVGGP